MTLLVIALFVGGFVAGLVDSIAGGGGLVTLPVLLGVGLDEHFAIATNKGQAVFGAVSSATSFWTRRGVDQKRAPLAFVAGAAGSFAGAALLGWVDPKLLRPAVVVLLVLAAVLVSIPKRVNAAAIPFEDRIGLGKWLLLGAIAFALGGYDGFFGPGTGTLLIVAFAWFFGDTLTRASGNAKIVNLASNVAALILFWVKGKIIWKLALPMAAGNAIGAAVGSRLAVKRGDKFVRVVVLMVVAAIVSKLSWQLAH